MTDWNHTTPLVDPADLGKAMILFRVEGDNPSDPSQDSTSQMSAADLINRSRVELLSSAGATLVGAMGEGAGATSSTVAAFLWHFVIHLTDYYTGTLTTGADITSALTKAVAAAAARRQALGGVGRIYIPAGYYYTLSATIVVPSFVEIHGAGKVETYLRRTGNYGNSFEFGTANPAANVQCCGISNLTIFHDHGNGTTAPADPANWVNSVTGSPAHVVAYTPVACCFERLDLNMLPLQFVCQGGSKSIFRSIDTYGVYDDANAAMQEGLAGFLMAADASVTASIPTWHLIDNCRFGGATRASTSVTYYGANTKTTTKNIGPQNGLVIWCAESLVINGCYTGACNSNGILISSKSTDIIAGIFIMGHFFDPCGVKYQDACLKFENRDTSGAAPDGVSVIGCQFKGQLNGWRAISDWGNTNTLGSVKDLIVEGCSGSNFVGNPVELYNDRNSRIEANWSAYNCMNWYSGDQACAIHIASGSINPTINGTLGGGTYGETTPGTNNRCVDGVRVDAWATSKPRLSVSSGGLSGSLIVGKPGPASVTVTSSPFTYTAGPQNETLYIYGGTVSLITQGGVTIATSTGLSVSLSPGEACVVTYSAAPTIKVKLQ